MARHDALDRFAAPISPPVRRSLADGLGAPPCPDRVPWDCAGAREIGFDIPARYNASAVLFENVSAGREQRAAVTGPAGQRNYMQLASDAARWGSALLALGLTRGDRVLLMLDDTPVYPAAFFGAVRAGLVPVLVNILSPPDLVTFYLADSGARAAIVEAALCDRLAVVRWHETELETLIVVNGADQPATPDLKIRQAEHWLVGFPERLAAADTHRDDMALWMYSSGSTGNPKAIVHLQHDIPYTHLSYAHHVLKLSPNDICFSVPKIFFSYGFGNSITFPFSVGATSLLMPGRPTPASVFAAVAKYRPTVFFGLPTLYTILVNAPEIETADFSSVRLAVSAAEILSSDVAGAWKTATNLDIIECLGSTEMLNVYLSNTPSRKKPGAAGVRVPGYEIVLRDDDGIAVGDGREGTMWIRGHSSTPSFWKNPARTDELIKTDGWLCTGDRFTRDHDGFYFFCGRTDDLVRISGQWVNPIEVQRCLADHPLVRECAVLPIERPDRRKVLKAFVAMKTVAFDPKATTRLLQEHVKHNLLPYKYPRVIEFLAELPKTGTGKIDRQALATYHARVDGEVSP